MIKNFIYIFIIAIFFSSCNISGCYKDTNISANCVFYNADQKASLDSTSVWGTGLDSMLYDFETLDSIQVTLKPANKNTPAVTKYVIRTFIDSIPYLDTLTLYYQTMPYYESRDCGTIIKYRLDSCKVKGLIFQSAIIANPEVSTNESIENVHLYL